MKLGEILTGLSKGELQSLAIGGSGSGTIPPEHRATLIEHINAALIQLFARFPLKESQAVIELHDHINIYYLREKYCSLNEDSPIDPRYRYIAETPVSRFGNDVLRIDQVFNKEGRRQDLNDDPLCPSVRIPEFDAIQVPRPMTGESLFIIYRASHEKILPDAKDSYEVHLPKSHLEALNSYVAHRVFMSMGGERQMAKGQEQLAKFNSLVSLIEEKNLDNNSYQATNTRFCCGGFV